MVVIGTILGANPLVVVILPVILTPLASQSKIVVPRFLSLPVPEVSSEIFEPETGVEPLDKFVDVGEAVVLSIEALAEVR